MKLKNCPFCGGEAELKEGHVFHSQSYLVRCTKCKAGTLRVIEGTYLQYRGEQNKHFTLDEARAEAVNIWNTRRRRIFGIKRGIASAVNALTIAFIKLYNRLSRNDIEEVVFNNAE